MKHPLPLEYDKYYHMYNRGINSETLFREPVNYEHFLRLYDEHITPVAETFAWVLMKNHLSVKPTKLQRDKVIGWFNSKSEFVEYHQHKHDVNTIGSIIIEE